MGVGYVASPHNYYEGRLKLAGESAVSPGIVVSGDFKAGTAAAGVKANLPLYFLAQENDEPIEFWNDDVDQVVKVGQYLKLASLDEVKAVKTTEVTGSMVAVGDHCAPNASTGVFEKGSGTEAWVVSQIDMIGDLALYTLVQEHLGA